MNIYIWCVFVNGSLIPRILGFNKEQLKITFDESSRSLTVHGERRLPNNSFTKDFKIPDNCNLSEMKAIFDQNNHLLTITMPKKTTDSIEDTQSTSMKDDEQKNDPKDTHKSTSTQGNK